MSDQIRTLRALRIVGVLAGWMGFTRMGPAAEIIAKCLPGNLSENPDGKEILCLVRTWMEALEEQAAGESKESLKHGLGLLNDTIAEEEPGAPLSADAALTIFMAGLSGGAQVDRQVKFAERRAETRTRHKHIREAVQAEMQSGEHKNVTSARNAVAERMGVTLKTVQNASKNI